MSKIVILGIDQEGTHVVAGRLERLAPVTLILETPVSRWSLAKRRATRLGWFRVAGQILFQVTVARWLAVRSRSRLDQIRRESSLESAQLKPPIRIGSVNSPECRELLQRLQPTVVVICGTRIVSPETLACVDARFYNMHAGITPAYRGVHGAYWALVDGRPDLAGVTVHLVDRGVDTGDIVSQVPIHPTAADNYATYPMLQLAAGLPELERAVRAELDGQPLPAGSRNDLPSVLRFHPTLWGYLWTRLRTGIG